MVAIGSPPRGSRLDAPPFATPTVHEQSPFSSTHVRSRSHPSRARLGLSLVFPFSPFGRPISLPFFPSARANATRPPSRSVQVIGSSPLCSSSSFAIVPACPIPSERLLPVSRRVRSRTIPSRAVVASLRPTPKIRSWSGLPRREPSERTSAPLAHNPSAKRAIRNN